MPKLNRLAPLATCVFALLLTACAGQVREPQATGFSERALASATPTVKAPVQDDSQPYTLPSLADTVLERGLALLGTPYRYGGQSERTGFDCSGFIGYLFREEAGIELPRSTREMIQLDAPLVSRDELQPGDILFFNNRGRGQVSHAGIYIGNDRFIHSASRRSGGVRVDSLDSRYWRASYMQARRVLSETPDA